MNLLQRTIGRGLSFALLLVLGIATVAAQTPATGTLHGQITDEFGGVIVGATVTVVDASGAEKTTTTDAEGNFTVGGLAPGKYTVRAVTPGFTLYENAEVEVTPGRGEALKISLGVSLEREEVTIASEAPISTEPENNADALVLRDSDLDALPDDPDELAAALQALAGPSGGPNGGQIFIDGFSGGRMPSRDTIREVRINQNPFTAENDRPGFGGRIEILTKPGTDKLRGSGFFTFMDESFNSRNPFLRSDKRPPFQMRRFGGNLSGSIVPKRSSFFIDFERNEDDENDIINARVLDPVTLNEVPFNLAVQTPQRRISFSPRVDYQINAANTLVARYSFFRQTFANSGLSSEFSLPSRAFDTRNSQHNLQLTETAILAPTVINETRFQFIHGRSERDGDNSIASVNVQGAFFGGGSQVGESFSEDNRWELQNYTTWTLGTHSLKAGGRVRGVSITDVSRQNFGGTFVFTSLDQFRNTLTRGPQDAATFNNNNIPAQFLITTGEPEARVSQVDFGGFIQDDWRLRPNFTLSMGLRYELQSNIDSKFNFAPRVAIAWSPGSGGQAGQPAKTVVRAGFGIFYDRVNENLTLQQNRFNGSGQRQILLDGRTPQGEELLSGVDFNPDGTVVPGTIPSIASLSALPQVRRRLSDELTAPYTYFAGFNVERQLVKNVTAFVSFGTIRSRNVLRLRNINAPLPGTFDFDDPENSNPLRPLGNSEGDILQYESTGISNMNQLAVGVNSRLSRNFTIFTNYVLSKAMNDTDGGFGPFGGGGVGSPANPYDLSGEYGRANFDSRHRFFFGGSFTVPKLNISLNPFIQANSGRPFNITTGLDTNGDSLFTERPAFATSATEARFLRRTIYGDFDLNPQPGQALIPRNFGEGPSFFSVNLRVTKVFGFGNLPGADTPNVAAAGRGTTATTAQAGGGRRDGAAGGGGNRGGGGGRGPVAAVGGQGGGGGPFGGGGAGGSEKRYNLALSLQFFNLLNHANLGQPVGNLSSRDFGNPVSLAGGFGGGSGSNAAGNRRIQAQLRFTF